MRFLVAYMQLGTGLFKMFSRWNLGISPFKYIVKGGTSLRNLWFILTLKTYLIFTSVVVVHLCVTTA